MINPNVQKWVDALRSGNYEQGIGRLKSRENQYCCLGVACNIYAEEHGLDWSEVVQWGGQIGLPEVVQEWLGLTSEFGNYEETSLIIKNDVGCWSFQEIASLIESRPEGLFKKDPIC